MSNLVRNPIDRFSRDAAHILTLEAYITMCSLTCPKLICRIEVLNIYTSLVSKAI